MELAFPLSLPLPWDGGLRSEILKSGFLGCFDGWVLGNHYQNKLHCHLSQLIHPHDPDSLSRSAVNPGKLFRI